MELVTTDLVSQKTEDYVLIGTPKYLNVCLISIICSVEVMEATNSDPYVAVSTVAFLFEYESMGVWFTKCKQPVRDLPVAKQGLRFASTVVVVVTVVQNGSGIS